VNLVVAQVCRQQMAGVEQKEIAPVLDSRWNIEGSVN
jgi:hypothetical protein